MSDLVIRPLAGTAEYRECVALQRRTWGEHFSEVVPPSLLLVAQEMGGIASGAFDGDRLVGFVFGISGLRDGAPAHWSDMLAVEEGYRGRGIGRALKLHQRERLLGIGVDRMLWTFDPLVARNAHLNLSRLGATARLYRRDVYGESDSPLHAGIGTDRLVAAWALSSGRVQERIRGTAPDAFRSGGAWVLEALPGGRFPRPGTVRGGLDAERLLVAIPEDIDALKAEDAGLAREWRAAVREALESTFDRGFVAVEAATTGAGAAAYVLAATF